MAKKKRKAARAPIPASGPAKAGAGKARERTAGERFLLPWLGVLALVAAWLAALGGVADGTLDRRQIFDPDSLRIYLTFLDLFQTGAYSASDWSAGTSPYYLPDMAFQWAALAAGMDVRAALYLASLAQAGAAAAGWMLVCDRLWGKNPARRAAVWLLHALAFLVLAWRGGDFLGIHLLSNWHYGAWAAVPWLLRLSLDALDDNFSPGRRRAALAGMFVLLVVMTASDLIVFTWFAVPAAVAALLTTRRDGRSGRALGLYLAALAAATALGPQAAKIPGFRLTGDIGAQFSFNPDLTLRAAGTLADILREMAAANFPEAAVWVLFVAVALWRLGAVAPGLDLFSRNADRFKPGGGGWRSLFGVPPGRAHRFVAVFVPASAAVAVGAVLATGNIHPFPWVFPHYERLGRHFLPFFYFPLFVGWALLPWRLPRWRVRPAAAALAGFALAVLLAAPKALSINRAGLDPFATPFQRCFVENARRLGWNSGVGSAAFTHPLAANPAAGVGRMAAVLTERGGGDATLRTPVFASANLNWWRGGDFQFVAVNFFNGRVFGRLPRLQDRGCAPTYPELLQCLQATPFILDEATARNVFGEPAEVVDCAGVGLFHYDPPLRFDPPEGLEELGAWEVRPRP